MKTICAIATGDINSAISVIRVSGDEAFNIVNKICSLDVEKQAHGTAKFSKLLDGNSLVDEVIVVKFVGPKSFTGEDTIEINCHGGIVVTNKIIELLVKNKATLAQKGEFSKRAFINGKMDLLKSKSINDLIHSVTDMQASISAKQFSETGISKFRENLLTLIATLEVNIDYPEYDDIEVLTTKTIIPKINTLISDLKEFIDTSIPIVKINQGYKVAIVGAPNAGKSSLINTLSGQDKAIVTDIPGTTRDVIETTIEIKGSPYTFFDTAGIRETNDKVEKLGIDKTKKIIKEADIVIRLIDSSNPDITPVEHQNILDVYNKSDLSKQDGITISCVKKDIKQLIAALSKNIENIDINSAGTYVSNAKDLGMLERCLDSLNDALASANDKQPVDLISIDLYEAIKSINEILGIEYNKGIIEEMFSKFCLGK